MTTPEPISFSCLEYERLLLEEIVTTDSIDFSEAVTNLFLSSDIKYHVAENVKKAINI